MDYFKNLLEYWTNLSKTYEDPRTKDWPLMSSPLPSVVISIVYVLFVLIAPKVMKNREAFKLKEILLVYNFGMVVLSTYIFYEFLASGWFMDYSMSCQPVDYSRSPKAMRMASVCWFFYMSKFVELLDTVFFILRKKNNQVSFLHVFHHGIMPPSWWFGVKFVAGGFGTFHGLLNSFIHLVMYSYYGLAALGEKYQKYLWWKKYMTQMQMLQFITVTIHASQLLFIECDYPLFFVFWVILYALIFLVFFTNFFVQEYYLKKNRIKKKIRAFFVC